MGGGLLQLVAHGAQDVNLTGNPQISFFKANYKRHTNFATQWVPQPMNGSPKQGIESTKIQISRNGDLVQEVYLIAKITDAVGQISTKDTVYPAERLVSSINLSIGGQQVDKHYQRWWRLFSELNHDNAKKDQYSKLTNLGATDGDGALTQGASAGAQIAGENGKRKQEVVLPLIFFFNRNPGLALPLMALQYSNVELAIKWGAELDTYVDPTLPQQIECWCKYIYLDDAERRLMVAKPQKYLIEQVQHNGVRDISDPTVGSSNLVNLEFNHPVKEIVWCHPVGTGDGLESNLWNMTHTPIDASVGIPTPVTGDTTFPLVVPHQAGGVVLTGNAWSEDAFGPCGEASIQINGQDVAINQSGTTYNQTQPFYHHSGCPVPGIYSYSFALNPESYQPSGTCNFSRIDNATLRFRIINDAVAAHSKASIFVTNYNIMTIGAGMASMDFAN